MHYKITKKNDNTFWSFTIITITTTSTTEIMNMENISADILYYNIFPKIGISSTVLLTKVNKSFNKNKKHLYTNLVKDDFLYDYTRSCNINIIQLLSESSFTYKLFDDIYEYINVNISSKKLFYNGKFIVENTSQHCINNTFRIFQMLKIRTNSIINDDVRKDECSRKISNMMTDYFKKIYFVRNDIHTYNCLFTSTSRICKVSWEYSNINLYNICENLNLLCYDKHNSQFKTNLKSFEETIVSRNKYHAFLTTELIRNIFICDDQSRPLEVDYYVNYIVLHYFNMEYHQSQEIYHHIVVDIAHILHEYMNDIKIDLSLISPYFKILIKKVISDTSLIVDRLI